MIAGSSFPTYLGRLKLVMLSNFAMFQRLGLMCRCADVGGVRDIVPTLSVARYYR